MAITNFESKEIHAKVIYCGPSQAGKTANLRSLLSQTSVELKSGLVDLSTSNEHDFYFDFLPVQLDDVDGFKVRLHLFTLPNIATLATTNSLILRGIDGFVFVADSRIEAIMDNQDSLDRFKRMLHHEGVSISQIISVFQYNKRDLPGILSVAHLRNILNPQKNLDQEAVAAKGIGTLETLEKIRDRILMNLHTSAG